jgi:hypothetical protein
MSTATAAQLKDQDDQSEVGRLMTLSKLGSAPASRPGTNQFLFCTLSRATKALENMRKLISEVSGWLNSLSRAHCCLPDEPLS